MNRNINVKSQHSITFDQLIKLPVADQDLLDKSNSECDHCQAELRDQTLDMALDQTNKQT